MKRHLKNFLKFFYIFLFITLIILGLVYLGLGYYYRDSFSYGTRINGIYCTGRTPAEVDKLLNERYSYDGLTIRAEGYEILIKPEDIDFSYDFKSALDIYLHNQNSWFWPSNLISQRNRTLNPLVSYNIAKLDSILDSYEIFVYDTEPDVSIMSENGVYALLDTTKHRPESEKMREAVTDCIYSSTEELIIDDSYYTDLEYTKAQMETIKQYESVKNMLGADITYIMGNERVDITDDILVSFLKRDDDGNLVKVSKEDGIDTEDNSPEYEWSPEAIETWVDVLADKYDTLGSTRHFKATGGFDVEVSGGIYGNKIDRKAEKDYLKAAIRDKLSEDHEPVYIEKALHQGIDDIGDTYVEVNMTDQKLYYYVNGELVIDTPVVTGNMGRRMNTPSGTNYVYYKQRNRTLIGPNYQTFVNYWMAVNGHIGIHDATWRDEFGGEIYLTSGSHGCINTPMDAVSQLYDMVEIGTPVIMYYTE
ncbi:MAG: L,D-transpeptidase/peptidoglycan binding protein [Lachnospiraceae bacterium]|nr:L,D-transpeptidase/peptidoglycan binding protein [Lachnospiraceae bacterium]